MRERVEVEGRSLRNLFVRKYLEVRKKEEEK